MEIEFKCANMRRNIQSIKRDMVVGANFCANGTSIKPVSYFMDEN